MLAVEAKFLSDWYVLLKESISKIIFSKMSYVFDHNFLGQGFKIDLGRLTQLVSSIMEQIYIRPIPIPCLNLTCKVYKSQNVYICQRRLRELAVSFNNILMSTFDACIVQMEFAGADFLWLNPFPITYVHLFPSKEIFPRMYTSLWKIGNKQYLSYDGEAHLHLSHIVMI